MLITYLLKVSLLLAVLTLGYCWLIQFETFSKVNRILLWFNVLAAWSLPLTPLPDWGPVKVQQEFHQQIPRIIESMPVVSKEIITKRNADIFPSNSKQVNLSKADLMLIVYLFGIIFLLTRLIFPLVKMFYALWRSPSEKLDNGIILIRNQNTVSPYSFFRWIICNPENHSPEEFEHILAHESEHILQLHSLDLLVAEVQKIILWFNPFAWFHQTIVQENLEYLADRAVLESGFHKKQYQFSLLKTVLQNHHLPLTNYFAQSLLKKRIKMMNRKPSNFWAVGKYAILVAMLYLTSAFVFPFHNQLAALIPSEIKPLVSPFVENTIIPDAENNERTTDAEELSMLKISTNGPESNIPITKKRSKWVLQKGDTLYWAIPSLANFDVINDIRRDIKDFGGELNINSIEYDPLQQFITKLIVDVKNQGGSGKSGSSKEKFDTPVKAESGYIIKGGGLNMGQVPPKPLSLEIEKDHQNAIAIQDANSVKYLVNRLQQFNSSSSNYLKNEFEGKNAGKIFEKTGIRKSLENTLLITEKKAYEFYLNTKPVSFTEINSILFDQVLDISIIENYTQNKNYIVVHIK